MKDFVKKHKSYCITGLFVICLACMCYLLYPVVKSEASSDGKASGANASANAQQLEESKEAATTTAEAAETTTATAETTTEAEEKKENVGYIAASDLNLRKKPTTDSKSLKKLDAGAKVTILDTDGKWYKVKSGKKTGYIKKVYVIDTWTAFSETNALNVRKKASTKSEVLTQIDKGDSMTVLKKEGKWYQVKHGDTTGYVRGDYITFQFFGFVDGTKVNLRKERNLDSKILKELKDGTEVTILTKDGKWYKVRYKEKIGYIHEAYISFKKIINADSGSGSSGSGSSLGSSIVSYAKRFLGNPYVYGGTSLTNGTDCSGFTQSVYRHFGIYLPRSSAAQRTAGTRVSSLSQAKPGDLICYYGHVAIYMGNNTVIHASNAKSGIKITYNAAYRSIASIRRVI